jgi:hypothetical protein
MLYYEILQYRHVETEEEKEAVYPKIHLLHRK